MDLELNVYECVCMFRERRKEEIDDDVEQLSRQQTRTSDEPT